MSNSTYPYLLTYVSFQPVLIGLQQIGAGEDLVYADLYEDIKAGRIPDPRTTQPDLPPKKELVSTPPLPPKAPARKSRQ